MYFTFRAIVTLVIQSLLISSLIFLASCAATKTEPVVEFIMPDSYCHIVKYQGETLSTIAGWYTGNTKNWEKLAELNKLTEPGKIEIGQKIFVPNSMLTRYSSLPEEMIVRKSYLKTQTVLSKVEPKSKANAIQYKRASLKINKSTKKNFLEESLKKLEQEKSLDKLIQK